MRRSDDEDDSNMTETFAGACAGRTGVHIVSILPQRCRLDAVTCKERVRRLCQHSRTHREHAITYQLPAISDAVLRRSVRLKFLRLSPVVAGKMLRVMEKSTRKAKEALVTRDLFLIMARWPAERAVNVNGAQLTVTYRVPCHNPSLARSHENIAPRLSFQ